MATTYPERTYPPMPAHTMHVVDDPHHDTAEALEAGVSPHQAPSKNAIKGNQTESSSYSC